MENEQHPRCKHISPLRKLAKKHMMTDITTTMNNERTPAVAARSASILAQDVKKVENLVTDVTEYVVQIETSVVDHFTQKMEQTMNTVMEKLSGMEQKMAVVTAENKAITAENKAITAENKAITKKLSDMEQKMAAVTAKNKAITAENKAITAENKAITKKLSDMKTKNETMDTKLSNLERRAKNVEDHLVVDAVKYTPAKLASSANAVLGVRKTLLFVSASYDVARRALHCGLPMPVEGQLRVPQNSEDEAIITIEVPIETLEPHGRGRTVSVEALKALKPPGSPCKLPNTCVKRVFKLKKTISDDSNRVKLKTPDEEISDDSNRVKVKTPDEEISDDSNRVKAKTPDEEISDDSGQKSPIVEIFKVTSVTKFLECFKELGNDSCLVFHFTSIVFADLIIKTGFRMSTQGQGDGGVYFSMLGPASYGLGTKNFESKMITHCFGLERLSEYRGTDKLKVVVVSVPVISMLKPVKERRYAVQIPRSLIQSLSDVNDEDEYYINPECIVGVFDLSDIFNLPCQPDELSVVKELRQMEKDNATKLRNKMTGIKI